MCWRVRRRRGKGGSERFVCMYVGICVCICIYISVIMCVAVCLCIMSLRDMEMYGGDTLNYVFRAYEI